MSEDTGAAPALLPRPHKEGKGRLAGLMAVAAGIILGQVILYGPSLCGRKVLLPLEVLAVSDFYLPQTPAVAAIAPINIYLADATFVFEPARRFAAAEVRAGRWPTWMPFEYSGVPYIEPRFSPFAALQFCFASPVVLAWTQLAIALVSGLGAYAFSRRVLGVRFWPATLCAWCYPLTAFFIFWEGYPISSAVCWLPWILLAVDLTVQGTNRLAPLALSFLTCLVLISGHLDLAGQVLLVSALFAVWRVAQTSSLRVVSRYSGDLSQISEPAGPAPPGALPAGEPATQSRPVGKPFAPWKPATRLAAAWALGLLLAAPQILPVLEYTRTAVRMARRSTGEEERPPTGLTALPQAVLPDMYGGYGVWNIGNFRFGDGNQLESSAGAYAGLIATLVVAPLAWCNGRRRSLSVFLVFASLFGLSWCLNLPGFVQLLRLPGLNMMSHNRLVFVAGFAILCLAAMGLDALLDGAVEWRRWMWAPLAALATLGLFCAYRAFHLPEPLASQLSALVQRGQPVIWIHDLEGVQRVRAWFRGYYLQGAEWCAAALLGWWVLKSRRSWHQRLVPILGSIMLGELLFFGFGRDLQCDWALYYPPIPALEQLAKAAPGRVMGCDCLPANLAGTCGLRDVRGYDAVDPTRMVELLILASEPSAVSRSYARTQGLVPKLKASGDGGIGLSPILDMLGVRYVIFRKPPFEGARTLFHEQDYWIMENAAALPRAFVPTHLEVIADHDTRLNKMASPQFDPREVAYLESAVDLPPICRGRAEMVEDLPSRVVIALQMETPGLVVLADRWDKGWQASLNGAPAPILVADHALRGVVVPKGSSTLEFHYAPASFAWGIRLCALALISLLVWAALAAWNAAIMRRRSAGLLSQIYASRTTNV